MLFDSVQEGNLGGSETAVVNHHVISIVASDAAVDEGEAAIRACDHILGHAAEGHYITRLWGCWETKYLMHMLAS
jgi:hypothetical protein